MNTSFQKDILRTIKKSKKRFIAILIITLLGVTMFSGLKAGCVDLRNSADTLFDQQNLHDLKIQSTLGCSDEDIKAVRTLNEISVAEGIYTQSVETSIHNKNMSLTIQSLSSNDIDTPYLLKGRMPKKKNEVVVTEKFCKDSSLDLNDSFTITKNEYLKSDSFKIVGIIIDVTRIDNPLSCTSFRTDSLEDNTIYALKDTFDMDVYSSIVIQLKDSQSLFCYGDEYKSLISSVKNKIEKNIKSEQETARQQELIDEGKGTIQKEEDKAYKKLKEALDEINSGKQELNDGLEQIYEAMNTLEANKQTADASFQSAWDEINQNEQTLNTSLSTLEQGQSDLNNAKSQLENSVGMSTDEIKNSYLTLVSSISNLQTQIDACTDSEMKETLVNQLNSLQTQKDNLEIPYNSVLTLETNQNQINSNREQIEKGFSDLENGKNTLIQKENSTYAQIESGKQEILANYNTLLEAQSELEEGEKEYQESKTKVENEFKKAYEELEDIEPATWYIQDRTSLSGYKNVGSDADSIEAIAQVFPVVFLVIAVLISLTTITRMVEEDRSLIGTYKALGFKNKEIRKKYEIYALSACGVGSVLGTIFAFIVLPKILFFIFQDMYLIPAYYISFIPSYGLLGPFIFMGGILLATILACQSELKQSPAILMRPKAPKSGSRVLLERIPFIWNSLSFLNKVTARNLFRYKKRMFMTIFGIAGCMALLLFGFGVKDSVSDLMPRQYEQTLKYDCLAISNDNEQLVSYFTKNKKIQSMINVEMNSSTIKKGNEELTVSLVVIKDDEDLDDYIHLVDTNGTTVTLKENDVFVSQNAANVLNFKTNDKIDLQLLDLQKGSLKVTNIVKNYLGNYIYMRESTFEKYFDSFEPNAVLLQFSDLVKNQSEYTDQISEMDGIINCLGTENLKEQFSSAFELINMVVYVIIFMSAALAFVVLFTLANTNISERERELATIKVLGFLKKEVHLYVNKETMILTGIGIVLGIPLGRIFVSTLTIILNLPSIYLETSLHGISYFISAGLSLFFAILVNWFMSFSLDAINMIEALKSVE